MYVHMVQSQLDFYAMPLASWEVQYQLEIHSQ